MRLIKNAPKEQQGATVAQVTFSEAGNFGVVGASEYRGIPVFAPKGIAYRPCEGDNLLILPVDGTDVCIGALAYTDGLAAGELRLSGPSGASLWLKNNGDVVINGLIITKTGQIITQGQEET
jgi:hypothetical protein